MNISWDGQNKFQASRNLLGLLMISWTRHVWYIGSNCLNLIHEVITYLCIILLLQKQNNITCNPLAIYLSLAKILRVNCLSGSRDKVMVNAF